MYRSRVEIGQFVAEDPTSQVWQVLPGSVKHSTTFDSSTQIERNQPEEQQVAIQGQSGSLPCCLRTKF